MNDSNRPGAFDRFASATSGWVSRAPFFVGCVLLVAVWAPSLPVFGNLDTWQLVINTVTTIVTFLLVALLQNSQARFEKATNAKLNAVADGVAHLLDGGGDGPECARDLRRAVGLEDEVGA